MSVRQRPHGVDVKERAGGVFMQRIRGEPRHCIGSLTPQPGQQPRFAQFYVSTMPNKSSPIDCISNSVIKWSSDLFVALIAHLAKISFREGKFPSLYKTASATPLLKKKQLDPDVASNYRPISSRRKDF